MHLTGRLAEHAGGRTFTGPTSGKFQQHLETGELLQRLPSVPAVVQQLASSGNRDPALAEDRD